jgi:hypothetical protein
MQMLNQPLLNFNVPYQEFWISNFLVQKHSFWLIYLNHGGYYWNRFEQTNGNMCRRNFITWSLSIMVVFGMISEWTNLYGSFICCLMLYCMFVCQLFSWRLLLLTMGVYEKNVQILNSICFLCVCLKLFGM